MLGGWEHGMTQRECYGEGGKGPMFGNLYRIKIFKNEKKANSEDVLIIKSG